MKCNMNEKNDNHPEKREGEIFFGNFDFQGIRYLPYKTLRRGQKAYDKNNNVYEDLFPVFVNAEEYNARRKE